MHTFYKKHRFYQKIASYMPRKLLYFAVIHAWAIATTGKYSHRTPDSLRWDEVLECLEEPSRDTV